jgi:hypothetical protein
LGQGIHAYPLDVTDEAKVAETIYRIEKDAIKIREHIKPKARAA